MESWFIRLNKNVFVSKWFHEFISNVTHLDNKYLITIKYEHGLSNLIRNNKCSWSGIYEVYGRFTYNHPKTLFNNGCPFIKKASFIRHNGALGKQIRYILTNANKDAVKSVMITANRIYGENYMKWLLTNNPIKILWRKIKYAIKKMVRYEKN